jgi:hypothetical protein
MTYFGNLAVSAADQAFIAGRCTEVFGGAPGGVLSGPSGIQYDFEPSTGPSVVVSACL